jgi:hypothetical protein
MIFREFVDSVQSIIAVAELVKNDSKDGTANMADFLYALKNAGISMDYDKFKTVYDSNPQLKNVIQQFDADSVTFVGGEPAADAPVGDIPPEEKVGQMAKRAMNKRESVEEGLPPHLAKMFDKYGNFKDPKKQAKFDAMQKKEREKKQMKWVDVTPKGYGPVDETTLTEFDRHQDIIDQIVDMQPETSNEIIRMAQKLGAPDKAIDDILQAVLDRVNIDEATNIGINILNTMEQIVDQKSAMEVKFVDGKSKVDMYTASAFMQVYNKVNDANQKKMLKMAETRTGFVSLMKKVFNIISGVKEGKSPHKKGTAKYKKHMAAMHAGESVSEGMEDKIKADIKAGMSSDAIIGKYANKRTTNTDEIRKMIQQIKWNMRKNNEDVQVTTEGFKIRDKSRGYGVSDKTYATRAEAEKARLLKMASTGGDWEVIEERSLTKAEKEKMKHYEKKLDKAEFKKRYGKEGEAVYYATATKMAKKNA